MNSRRLNQRTITVLVSLALGFPFSGTAYANVPILQNPGGIPIIPNTTCPPNKVTQDMIDLAYDAYREHLRQDTLEYLQTASVCAKLGKGLNPDQIDAYRSTLAAEPDLNNWPPFPFGVTQVPVADNGNPPQPNQTFPTIIGAVGSLLESFIQSSATQNPQPAPQAPPNAAPTVANDQSPANQTLAQWGLQQVPCNSPGLVFISGLGSDVLCINPTAQIPAGEYNYNAATHQLINTSSAPTVNGIN